MMVIAYMAITFDAYSQPDSLDDKLRQADEMLSTDVRRGTSALGELRLVFDQMETQQKYRYEIILSKKDIIEGNINKAIKKLLELGNNDLTIESKIQVNKLLSISYNAIGNYADMFERINNNLKFIEEIKDVSLKAGFLHPVILAFRDAGAIDEAIEYSREMLEISRSVGHVRSECFALDELGISYRHAGSLELAKTWLEQAVSFCRTIDNKLAVSAAKFNLAELELDLGHPNEALALSGESLILAYDTGYVLLASDILAVQAEAYRRLGNLDDAVSSGLKGLAEAEKADYKLALRNLTLTLAKAHEALGNTAEALGFYKRHIAVNHAVQNDKLARQLAYHRTRYDTLDKQRQIQILNQQNELLTLSRQLDDKARQNMQLLLIIGAGLLIALLFWLAHAINQRRAYRRQAQCDALTGLDNRGHFIARCRAAVAAARAGGQPMSLILFDLDHFKKLNDSHGHAAGDWVLRAVAAKCREHIRKSDIFGRIGGEEFAICMPDASIEEAMRVAETCRGALAAIDSSELAADFHVTASFGIAARRDEDLDIDALLVRADDALYEAKRAGRDQVRTARGDAPPATGPAPDTPEEDSDL